jgi:hypothetical protein
VRDKDTDLLVGILLIELFEVFLGFYIFLDSNCFDTFLFWLPIVLEGSCLSYVINVLPYDWLLFIWLSFNGSESS